MQLEGREIGRYRILSLIGHGAMGDVYHAEDPRIQQQVAIKVLTKESYFNADSGTADNLAPFRDEARAISRLKHPHIVALYDYDEITIEGTAIIYLVTQYYKEGSLARWLQQRGTRQLPLEDVKFFISQAAEALQHAHTYQIVHRDVKPSNFLIDTEGVPNPNRPNLLLTDFGIAQFTTSSTASAGQYYLGGLTYMAPEQFNGQSTYASDQYALAIMAYELLTGRPPFQGAPQVIMRQHFDTPPDPPSSVNPTLPKAIDTVILTALAKKPEDRFGSIEAFAAALQRPVPRKSLPPHQQPSPPVPPPPTPQPGPPVPPPPRGQDVSTTLVMNQIEAQRGGQKTLMLGGRSVPVQVPPNAYNGQIIHLAGLGKPSPAGGAPGNLLVTISITPYQPAPPPPSYSPPPVAPGPYMPQQNPNRTLWLVLGIAGGVIFLLFLCAIVYSVAHP